MTEPARPPSPTLPVVRAHLATLPAARRVTALMELPNLREVLKRLCPQDLLVALHARGVGDCLELVEQLPASQVQSFIDLEAWRRDRIEPRALASWLSLLYAASPERALAQLMGLDAELVTLFLKLHTRVYDVGQEAEPEPLPEGSLRTPDLRYLVTFVTPPHPEGRDQPDPTDSLGTEVARRLVGGLLAREPFTAARYLEAVRWELPSELEESCLRWRNGRLADYGYYETTEAQHIYAPVDLRTPPRRRVIDLAPADDGPDTALALFIDDAGGAPLLRRALEQLPLEARDMVRRQLAALCNRVVAAQQLPPADVEALTVAAREAAATVNLGLEYLSRGDLAQAAQCIDGTPLLDLFRTGHTVVWQVARQARKVQQRLTLPGEPRRVLLPSFTQGVFRALCGRVPRLELALLDVARPGQVPFESFTQLARVAELVADTAFGAALLLDVGKVDLAASLAQAGRGTNAGNPAEADLDVLLATWLMRRALGVEPAMAPLTTAELERVRALVAEGAEPLQTQLRGIVTSQTTGRLPLPGALDEKALEERTARLATRVAGVLTEELAQVAWRVDPRFVASLLCAL